MVYGVDPYALGPYAGTQAPTGATTAGTITGDGSSDATASGTLVTPGTLTADVASEATAAGTVTTLTTVTADGAADGTAAGTVTTFGTIDADGSSDASVAAVTPTPGTIDADAGSDADASGVVPVLGSGATGEGTSDADAAGTIVIPGTITADAASDGSITAVVVTFGAIDADAGSESFVIAGAIVGSITADGSSDAYVTGVVVNPAVTQITWGGGRVRDGIGMATWEPPVDPTPPTVVTDINRMYANVIDTVTLDGRGRITLTTRKAEKVRHRHRILVHGKDVTYFRGVETPEPTYALIEPLLYGSGSITFPQISAAYETPGVGALHWLQPFARVKVQRVDEDGHVVNDPNDPDYLGFIADFDRSGDTLTCALGGQATGRGALVDRQPPVFPMRRDMGDLLTNVLRYRLRIGAHDPPDTGIKVTDFGGGTELDFITELTAKSTTLAGNQWTVMPAGDGRYRVQRKDTTTIDATVYLDDAEAVGELRRDLAEETTRMYATAVQPNGLRDRGAVYPGQTSTGRPPYPMLADADMPPGTSDADTYTGGGVTAMIWRLWVTGYLDGQDPIHSWSTGPNDPITDAVASLQDDAGLTHPTAGTMDIPTWHALYDPDVTGYRLRGSLILPQAQRSYTRRYRRNASGQVIGRNPRWKPHIPPVDRTVDMGTGFLPRQVTHWCRQTIGDAQDPNLVGSITINTGAVIRGEHNPGDPITGADLMDTRALRAGMNIWLPTFDLGTLVHVSGIDKDEAGNPRLTVDTRARDTMEAWEVVTRNRESRRSAMRTWIGNNRSSGQTKDTLEPWDALGGIIDNRVELPGHTWIIFPMPAGREGQVRNLDVQTIDAPAEFVIAFFGRRVWPARLTHLVGNPLTDDGERNWRRAHGALNGMGLFYSAGTGANPAGYHPTTKPQASADFPDATPISLTSGTTRNATLHVTSTPPGPHTIMWGDGTTVATSSPNGATHTYAADATRTVTLTGPEGFVARVTATITNGSSLSSTLGAREYVTGRFVDEAGFPYRCAGTGPALWCALYADRDSHLAPGRLLTVQLSDQV